MNATAKALGYPQEKSLVVSPRKKVWGDVAWRGEARRGVTWRGVAWEGVPLDFKSGGTPFFQKIRELKGYPQELSLGVTWTNSPDFSWATPPPPF